MRAISWCVIAGLTLAGCGVSPDAVDSRAPVTDSQEVTQQACPPGTASRVKVITPSGTGPVIISGRASGDEQFVSAQGKLFFAAALSNGPTVLWRTDGTPAGTSPVKVFFSGVQSPLELYGLVAVGNQIFFQIDTPGFGQELWVSDGTEPGTRLVKDLTPGPASSFLTHVNAVNGRLVFIREAQSQFEVWRSDGTAAGTVKVATLPQGSQLSYASLKVGNALHLFLSSASQGTSLWRTDGTTAGTSLVKKLDADAIHIDRLGQAGSLGLFLVDDGPNHEVWKTDGTPAGTVRLETFSRSVSLLGALGSFVYVATYDSATNQFRVERVSLSGGGKTFITSLPNRYASDPDATPYLQRTTASGGKLYFTVAISSVGPAPRDVELWVTDGTATGTRLLHHPLSLGDEYTSPLFATGAGPVLFAGSVDGAYVEPWFTQGTPGTTGLLADIGPGPYGSNPDGFARLGSRVFFFASDDTGDYQLWSAPASFSCPPGPMVSK